jgi:hypothetical protein
MWVQKKMFHQSASMVTPQSYWICRICALFQPFPSHLVTTDLQETQANNAQGTGARRFSGFRSKGSENFTAKRPDTEIVCPHHQNFHMWWPGGIVLWSCSCRFVFGILRLSHSFLRHWKIVAQVWLLFSMGLQVLLKQFSVGCLSCLSRGHYITLNDIIFLNITEHYITLHYITSQNITENYITIHYIHYIKLHYITLHYITLHDITLYTCFYITLHDISLHNITEDYITLHFMTLQ